MAKTKLLVSTKDSLVRFAKNSITTPKETKDRNAAYLKAASMLSSVIKKEFPAEHMELLKKYNVARIDMCIRVVNENGRVLMFDFEETDAPLLPSRHCSSRNFTVSKECLAAIDTWELKVEEEKRAKNVVLQKYKALIDASRYAEDLIDMWPASKTILEGFIQHRKQNLPVAVSPDVIAFVKKDNAGQPAKAV